MSFSHRPNVQALVTFFDVEFSKCPKKTRYSNEPDAAHTHWKQTTFYLRDYMTCKKKEDMLNKTYQGNVMIKNAYMEDVLPMTYTGNVVIENTYQKDKLNKTYHPTRGTW